MLLDPTDQNSQSLDLSNASCHFSFGHFQHSSLKTVYSRAAYLKVHVFFLNCIMQRCVPITVSLTSWWCWNSKGEDALSLDICMDADNNKDLKLWPERFQSWSWIQKVRAQMNSHFIKSGSQPGNWNEYKKKKGNGLAQWLSGGP